MGFLAAFLRDSAIKSGCSLKNLAGILSSPVDLHLPSFESKEKIIAAVVSSNANF